MTITTIRELSRHISHTPPSTFSLRTLLGRTSGPLTLRRVQANCSVMTHNMGLLPPVAYKGEDRKVATKELVHRLKKLEPAPAVVGLCEVYLDLEKGGIHGAVSETYADNQWIHGPDAGGPLNMQNGACMLMSKHPMLAHAFMTYSATAGIDGAIVKGVLHMRVQPWRAPRPVDVFFSHMQDADAAGGWNALKKQLGELRSFVDSFADPDNPVIIMGDLNVRGEVPSDYAEFVAKLGHPVDLWLASGGDPKAGFTYAMDNDFSDDEPNQANHRLDYVLLRPGRKAVPLVKSMRILKWRRGNHNISDHYGLLVEFDQWIELL